MPDASPFSPAPDAGHPAADPHARLLLVPTAQQLEVCLLARGLRPDTADPACTPGEQRPAWTLAQPGTADFARLAARSDAAIILCDATPESRQTLQTALWQLEELATPVLFIAHQGLQTDECLATRTRPPTLFVDLTQGKGLEQLLDAAISVLPHCHGGALRAVVTGLLDSQVQLDVIAGELQVGQMLRLPRSGETARVTHIEPDQNTHPVVHFDTRPGLHTGDLLCAADHPAEYADQFRIKLLWFGSESLLPGRHYHVRINGQSVEAQITAIRYRRDPHINTPIAAKTLQAGELAECNISLAHACAFDPYTQSRETGSFTIHELDQAPASGFACIEYALRRAHNIHLQASVIDKSARASAKHQRPCILWFTGLSGAGKSTLANALEQRLHALHCHTYLLDGDNVRHGLNRDLGFTDADRVENIRRIAEVAKLMLDAGLIVLTAFISPFRAERAMARELVGPDEFLEIFVDAPLSVVEARDPKGLYKKARRGELKNFTGLDSPYEAPLTPELHLQTAQTGIHELVEIILATLQQRGILPPAIQAPHT